MRNIYNTGYLIAHGSYLEKKRLAERLRYQRIKSNPEKYARYKEKKKMERNLRQVKRRYY